MKTIITILLALILLSCAHKAKEVSVEFFVGHTARYLVMDSDLVLYESESMDSVNAYILKHGYTKVTIKDDDNRY